MEKDTLSVYFAQLPKDLFDLLTFDQLFDMLSLEQQIELALKKSVVKNNSFSKFPIVLIAYMMKDANNSSIRSLIRADSFLRNNASKIVDEIGKLRHGVQWKNFKERIPFFEVYPAESLLVYEAVRLFFEKKANHLNIYLLANNEKAMHFNFTFEKDTLYIYDMSSTQKYIPNDGYLQISKPSQQQVEELMLEYVVKYGLRVDVDASEFSEKVMIPSKKDGKPFNYEGERKRDISYLGNKCEMCANPVSALCGNNKACGAGYCSQEHANQHWRQGHAKDCILRSSSKKASSSLGSMGFPK